MRSEAVRILVLDDEEVVRDNLRAFFEDEGFDVLPAGTAEEALKVLTEEPVDVAIVDVRLPVMNGTEFILQAHTAHPALKFIIYTGSPDFTVTPYLTEAGVQAGEIISKPLFDMKVLSDSVRRLTET
jgi:DNA-binding NtrC family response regulator